MSVPRDRARCVVELVAELVVHVARVVGLVVHGFISSMMQPERVTKLMKRQRIKCEDGFLLQVVGRVAVRRGAFAT
jgi:hypothetical protein